MKVSEVMTRDVRTCTPDTNLADAAIRMWDNDCGTLPVIDENNLVTGMVTDRDICIAAATRHQDIANIQVGELAGHELHSCSPDADLRDALKVFEKARVRRLPVVDDYGKLEGILSLRDMILIASEGTNATGTGISHSEVMNALRAISMPHEKAMSAGARI